MTKQTTRASRRPTPRTAPRRRPVLWAGAAAALVLVTVILIVFTGGDGERTSARRVWDPAPATDVLDFDGETVRLADSAGQGLVVNYWASWCLPCLAELPGFEQVYQRHRDEVAFLGINIADDPSSAQTVAEDTGISYPLAVDPDGTTFAAFGAFAMPTTVFISANGEILELYSGPLTATQLEARVEGFFGI